MSCYSKLFSYLCKPLYNKSHLSQRLANHGPSITHLNRWKTNLEAISECSSPSSHGSSPTLSILENDGVLTQSKCEPVIDDDDDDDQSERHEGWTSTETNPGWLVVKKARR
ncbi:unnamed protein product [Cuscuta epithymum]|uniref:Uncharacterized protein n=1 Tax=Cuscuta epithymum TaxID=186058 RepID=A0AAV0FYX8_9ASTE|nr:unnamed protein product [Cuscuta epithymum]CAH9140761.1 unnamed protein product [Cuscuta epithymum]